ncbi:hypothetical protein KM915_20875 [Cytobacillus oceanisediminis]|uniref:hypothetical protein n=1 Tax=Cytobacillus oceanisediminis TaxID=665099 RepID=UPI001C21F77B|nr:hypothetical protein [Cytobacillus oceanisediminis]MBU8732505.1 hypothetical protein [Cytobacillus oceanisediminis]
MERENDNIQLDSTQYRRFIMKLLNEDQNDLAQNLTHSDDVVKAYFFQESTSEFIQVELDTANKTLNAGDYSYLIYDKYMEGEVKLLHTDLQSEEMFRDVEAKINELKETFGVSYNPEIFADLIERFEKNDITYTVSLEDIREIYKDLQKNNEITAKIDTILDSIKDYKETYKSDEIMNFSVITNSAEKQAKMDIYFDSWTEMKELYERQSDFQKTSLKIAIEDFLKDKNNIFREIDLDLNNTKLADYLSKTPAESLSNDKIIPLVFEANENSAADKMRNNMLVHNSLEYMEYSLKRIELYEPFVSYSKSNLEDFIEVNKDRSLTNVMYQVDKEVKSIYGENFQLFNENDSISTRKNLFDHLMPIVNKDTFNLHEIQNIDPITKRDYEVRDFWENKNLEMLLAYMESKNVFFEASIDNLFLKSKDIEELMVRIPELINNQDEVSNKAMGRIKEAIEDTKEALYQMKIELAADKSNLDSSKNINEVISKVQHNTLMNNVMTVKNLESNIEKLEIAIDRLENTNTNEIEKENHKEMELER